MSNTERSEQLDELRYGLSCNSNDKLSVADLDGAEVVAYWDDGQDETSYAWVVKLKDGRYFTGDGGHDYTGWDCQSSLSIEGPFSTEDEARNFGLTQNLRDLVA